MAPQKRLSLNNGRVLVAAFLVLMGVLFTLTALVFQAGSEKWTILSVAGVMYLGGFGAFVLALRYRG